MTNIHHIALWTHDLERSKAFYTKYFALPCNEQYINSTTGFRSYFVGDPSGTRLELMAQSEGPAAGAARGHGLGWAHIALSVGSAASVRALTDRLRRDGYAVVSAPRVTGDGYFESVIEDPDGNRVELTV